MKGSTTSSGKRGGVYKDSAHSSQADIVEKWGHDGYEALIQQEQDSVKSGSNGQATGTGGGGGHNHKQSVDFSNQSRDDNQFSQSFDKNNNYQYH